MLLYHTKRVRQRERETVCVVVREDSLIDALSFETVSTPCHSRPSRVRLASFGKGRWTPYAKPHGCTALSSS